MKEKRPPGRPASINGKLVMVNLDHASHAAAALLGHGNVSAGIRLALRLAAKPNAPFPPFPMPEPPIQQQAQPFPYPPGFGPK